MEGKLTISERIVEDLIDNGCVDFPTEFYQEQKQEAVKVVLHRLEDYVIVEGMLIE